MKSLNQCIEEGILDTGLSNKIDISILWEDIKGDFLDILGKELIIEPTQLNLTSDGILQVRGHSGILIWNVRNAKKYDLIKGLEIIVPDGIICMDGDCGFKKDFSLVVRELSLRIRESVSRITNMSIQGEYICFYGNPKEVKNVKLICPKNIKHPCRVRFIWDEKLVSNLTIDGNFQVESFIRNIKYIPSYIFGDSIKLENKIRKSWLEIFNIFSETYPEYYIEDSKKKTRKTKGLSDSESQSLKQAVKTWLNSVKWTHIKSLDIQVTKKSVDDVLYEPDWMDNKYMQISILPKKQKSNVQIQSNGLNWEIII